MPVQFSVRVRNARLDAIEATTGASPKLRIYSGAMPANCAAAPTGTLIAEITCPADWLAAASNGSKVLNGSWTVAATNAGTAGYYRIYDSAGTNCDEQGNITATGGGGSMTVDNTIIAAAQTVTVTTKTLTDGNA
ncbi:hypothetical protein [Acidovorax sp. RAC01]|uniref:hypothetical protein n=1 Tax=Acidovorax sp. RAC01 TaxID=1842533 RepID=UPI00083E6FD3|nr:hypothetical protein [Acidovorax sp. RAC01]AOG21425.1 hypothetical protein BSY15_3797 [Acidovorax sp. RAC01]AOG23642.1 hypothetical protein BSY15_3719 [Acidovorax sp. RAC01]